MRTRRLSRGIWVGLGLGLAWACGPKETDTSASGGTETGGSADSGDDLPTTDDSGTEPGQSVQIATRREVDLLFVIDNSGSMAEEQALLTKNIAALIGELEASDVQADYRVGVTTTDSSNPRCPSAQYTPEGGNLVRSSCLDRVDQGEFTFNADDFSSACTDFCARRDSDLQVLGTATDYDPAKAPRKWVERTAGVLNIAGIDAVEALRCYLPQGVAGCGFESHLESMYLALAGAQSQNSKNNYGFLRDQAQLAIVMVSDETDCSYTPAFKDIFTTNKVFWNDPGADTAPTSAMCWHAGVACTGGPGTYAECHGENYDNQGNAGVAAPDAVLQPVSNYVDFVKQIEKQRQVFDANQRVKVSLLTGVPVGYDKFEKELQYADAADDEYQFNFGIGPGCVIGDPNAPEAAAVPPVREREFAEAFYAGDAATRPLYSVCQDSYAEVLATIGKEIADGITPGCFPYCVRDVEAGTPVVDADCEVVETDMQGNDTALLACEQVGGKWQPGNGAAACFARLVDRTGAQTPSPLDDMSQQCADEGYNLELVVVRAQPAEPGSSVSAKCELSANKAQDCPNL